MFAAKSGHSTLGIPQKVGAEFVAADPGGKLPQKKADGGEVKKGKANKKVEDKGTHFHVTGPHGTFMIAKKQLHPKTIDELTKMCSGGEVKGYSGASGNPDDQVVGDTGDQGDSGIQPITAGQVRSGKEMLSGLKDAFTDPFALKKGGPLAEGGALDLALNPFQNHPKDIPHADSKGDAAASASALAANSVDQTDLPAQGAGAAGTPTAPEIPKPEVPNLPGVSDASKHDKAVQKGALMQTAQAQADEANAQAAAYDNQQKQAAKEMEQYESDRKQMVADRDEIRKSIMNSTVDPNHYWAERGTGGRIMASIGLALAGIGGGLMKTGGNAALDVIQKNIDRDINAQKVNLETKQSLLRDNYERTGDLRLAHNETQLFYLNQTKAQVEKLASTAKGKQALSNAQYLGATLDKAIDDKETEVAGQRAILRANAKNTYATAVYGQKAAEYAAQMSASQGALKGMSSRVIANLQGVQEMMDAADSIYENAGHSQVAGALKKGDNTNLSRGTDYSAMAQAYAKALHGGPSETAAAEFQKFFPGLQIPHVGAVGASAESYKQNALMFKKKAWDRGQELNAAFIQQGYKPPFPEIGLPGQKEFDPKFKLKVKTYGTVGNVTGGGKTEGGGG